MGIVEKINQTGEHNKNNCKIKTEGREREKERLREIDINRAKAMERKKGRYCYSICRQPLLYFPSDLKHVETTKTAITKPLSPRKKRKGMLFFDNYLKDLLVWYKTKYMLGSNCIVNRYIFINRSKNFMIFLSNFLYSHVFLQNFNKYFFF